METNMLGFQKTDVMGRICDVKDMFAILEFSYQNGQKGQYNIVKPKLPLLSIGDWVFTTGELVGDTLSPFLVSVLSSEKIPEVPVAETIKEVVIEPNIVTESLPEKEFVVAPLVSTTVSPLTSKPSIFKKPLFNMATKPLVQPVLSSPPLIEPSAINLDVKASKPLVPEVAKQTSPVSTPFTRNTFQKPKMMLGRGTPPPLAPATIAPTGYRKIAEVSEDDGWEYSVEEPEVATDVASQGKAPSTPRTTPDSVDKDIPW